MKDAYDPYFKPSGPIISDRSVAMLCGTAMILGTFEMILRSLGDGNNFRESFALAMVILNGFGAIIALLVVAIAAFDGIEREEPTP